MFDWIIQNKEIFKIIYGLIIFLICVFITFRSHKFFRLSNHKGIRYFRNAFFFYGIAFATRYFLGTSILENVVVLRWGLTKFFFEFFMILAGFFLLYSLLWKKIEKTEYRSSIFNLNVLIFYAMAFILTFLDLLWSSYLALFFSQIILFSILLIVSYSNYLKKGNKPFLRFYFLAMAFGLIAWILNYLAATMFLWDYSILITIYCLNIAIFLLFLYGVIKITNRK